MTFDEAALILGVKRKGLTENAVRLAFASAVKLAHPDAGGGFKNESTNLARIREAKDTLLKIVETGEPSGLHNECRQCKGKGTVRSGFFSVICKTCGGTGNENLHRR